MRSTDPAPHARPGATGLRQRGSRTAAGAVFVALLALLLTGFDLDSGHRADGARARAAAYPSWQDVQSAKASEGAATAKVAQITALIERLESRAAAATELARVRGAELQTAQNAFEDAAQRAQALRDQARESRMAAEQARERAGALAAQLHRSGNNDVTMSLMLSAIGGDDRGASADLLLGRLSSAAQLVRTSGRIFAYARATENTAQSVAQQADEAKQVREKRRTAATVALEAAQSAATAAAASVTEQEENAAVLKAQLAALKDTTARTVQAYQTGVEEARRRAAAAAATGAGRPAGSVSAQGWALPVRGRISSPYGLRTQPCSDCTSFHRGVDIAAPSAAPIFAAAAGTVVYAGPLGTYGNFVLIEHAGGVATGYAHIAPGGILVAIGARVRAGEQIARVGMTGAATGYHLHFEVRTGGTAIDPVPFMRQRGVELG